MIQTPQNNKSIVKLFNKIQLNNLKIIEAQKII